MFWSSTNVDGSGRGVHVVKSILHELAHFNGALEHILSRVGDGRKARLEVWNGKVLERIVDAFLHLLDRQDTCLQPTVGREQLLAETLDEGVLHDVRLDDGLLRVTHLSLEQRRRRWLRRLLAVQFVRVPR